MSSLSEPCGPGRVVHSDAAQAVVVAVRLGIVTHMLVVARGGTDTIVAIVVGEYMHVCAEVLAAVACHATPTCIEDVGESALAENDGIAWLCVGAYCVGVVQFMVV